MARTVLEVPTETDAERRARHVWLDHIDALVQLVELHNVVAGADTPVPMAILEPARPLVDLAEGTTGQRLHDALMDLTVRYMRAPVLSAEDAT